jgi:ATP-binding cassette subfamily B multidrug efflux pump
VKTNKLKQQKGTLLRVLQYVKPYRVLVIVSLLCACVSAAAQLLIPILTGKAIDQMLGAGQVNLSGVLVFAVWIAVVAALSAAAQQFLATSNNKIAYNISRDLRNAAFHKLQRLPLSYLDAHPSGDLVSRMIADVDTFSDGLLMGFTQLFTGVVLIVGTLTIMLIKNWMIALLVVVLTPLSMFVASFIARKTHHYFTEQARVRGQQTALINELIEGQKVVQSFGHEAASLSDFDCINDELGRVSLNATFFSSLTNPSTRLVNNIIYAAVALVGALSAVGGGISVGDLSVFLSYASQYAKPFNEISGVVTELQNALACAARVFSLLDEDDRVPDKENAAVLSPKGTVDLKDVCFRYVPDRPLIEGFNLHVKPGQRIAIVGPTGCGKTTMINLLMRFYDVNSGAILVDGTDIRDATRHSLRKSFGMVLQDTWLKAGTIRDNIAYGRPDASEEDVIAAAKAAHAHSFIRRLPDGYDTVITENGGNISQGQKQLLCIARVMLGGENGELPPMLILDEATSSIDTRTEIKIQSAFARLMNGRTSFIVAHRLSTIQEADVILVMKDGHIIEQGTHEELLKKQGFYANLYQSQFALS